MPPPFRSALDSFASADPEAGPAALARYARQLSLPGFGVEGQRRLERGSVLLVGAGGLGSPVALYLAAAGVGRLGIVDFDRVDITNLHRQLLHGEADVGRPKTDSARQRLASINSGVHVETHPVRFSARNALELVRRYDVVVDGSDNFSTRYLVSDACVLAGTPDVMGSVLRFAGQVSVLATPDGPCYRCVYPEPPPADTVPTCAEGGVLGVVPGLVGMIQATETIKLLAGVGTSLAGRLLLVEALRMRFDEIQIDRNPRCPACGTREITELVDDDERCFGNTETADGDPANAIPAPRLAELLREGRQVDIIDVREPFEFAIARIPGARLVPLGTLERAIPTLDPHRQFVMLCHHGARSHAAAELLRSRGFMRVWNLIGGIDAWSTEVDPAVPRY